MVDITTLDIHNGRDITLLMTTILTFINMYVLLDTNSRVQQVETWLRTIDWSIIGQDILEKSK